MTKAEQIAYIPPEKISQLSGPEGNATLRRYISTMRQGYIRRVRSFENRNLVSYAQIQFEKNQPPVSTPLKKMNRTQLLLEYYKYQQFFRSQTSTVAGIKKLQREQDIRLFGETKTGRPKKTMTREQRELYWELYDEYLNQNPNMNSQVYSERVQQVIAQALFVDLENPDQKVSFFQNISQRMEQRYIEENIGSVPNVHMGRGFIK